jgi:hypothetical protein
MSFLEWDTAENLDNFIVILPRRFPVMSFGHLQENDRFLVYE